MNLPTAPVPRMWMRRGVSLARYCDEGEDSRLARGSSSASDPSPDNPVEVLLISCAIPLPCWFSAMPCSVFSRSPLVCELCPDKHLVKAARPTERLPVLHGVGRRTIWQRARGDGSDSVGDRLEVALEMCQVVACVEQRCKERRSVRNAACLVQCLRGLKMAMRVECNTVGALFQRRSLPGGNVESHAAALS